MSTPSAETFPFDLVRPHLDLVESAIRAQATAFDPAVEDYVSYVAGTSGKRIRPALAVLAGGATGEAGEPHRRLGLVLELIHIATLVHDDIMDGATLRRGMPTAAAQWGPSLSVLLGDCLFAHALVLASDFEDGSITRRIALASNDVCMGEILQTQKRYDFELSYDTYFKIIRMKTAALFAAACELSAALNGQSPEAQARLKNYGNLLGSAYQIYDDCLDLVGDENLVGKTLGTDLVKGKLTLPLLKLLEKVSDDEHRQIREQLQQRQQLNLLEIATPELRRQALQETVTTALGMLEEARQDLSILPENEYATALHGLTWFLDSRLKACV